MEHHKYPAVLLPQEVESIERAVAAHEHALVEAYVSARQWEARANELSASLNAERAAHEKLKKQYNTAVQSRILLRDGFRKWRDRAMKLEAWVQDYGWPIMDELEQWQDGHPPLAGLRDTVATLERQLGETQAALGVAVEALRSARIYVDRMTIQVGPVPHEGLWQAKRVLQQIDAVLTPSAAGVGE